jgi:hypothetical protein
LATGLGSVAELEAAVGGEADGDSEEVWESDAEHAAKVATSARNPADLIIVRFRDGD